MSQDFLRDQINNIILKHEDKATAEAMTSLAHSLTIFILTCEADGLTREEAVLLANSWLQSIPGHKSGE